MRRLFVFIVLMMCSIIASQGQIIENLSDFVLKDLRLKGNYGIGAGKEGRIIRTIDGGSHWDLINPSVPMKEDLTTVFISPSGLSYVGGANGVLLKSENAGSDWSNIDLPFKLPVTSIHFIGDSVGLIAQTDAISLYSYIFRTNDGGISWRLIRSSNTARFHDLVFVNETIGFFVADRYLLKTIDRGKTWSEVADAGYYGVFQDISFISSSIGFLMSKQVLLKTTDGGTTWIRENPNLIDAFEGTQIQFFDEQTGYYSYGGSIYKTTNGGLNWNEIVKVQHGGAAPFYFTSSSKGFYINGASNDMFKTNDSGEHWSMIYGEPGGVSDQINAYMHVVDANLIFRVTRDSVLWRSDNGGFFWYPKIFPHQKLNSVFFTDANTGFLAGDNGIIYKTSNGGVSWQIKDSYTTKELLKVTFRGSNGVTFGNDGTVLKSSDAGETWTNVSIPIQTGNHIFSGDIIDNQTMVAIVRPNYGSGYTEAQGLYKTIDGGVTWTRMTNSTNSTFTFFYDGNFKDASSYTFFNKSIFHTLNGGNNLLTSTLYNSRGQWLGNSTGYDNLSVHFPKNGNIGYLTGYNGYLLKTTDAGVNWQIIARNQSYSFSNYYGAVRMYNDTTGFLASTEATDKITCDLSDQFIKGAFHELCAGTTYFYSLGVSTSAVDLIWSFQGGTKQEEGDGYIAIKWNATGSRFIKAVLKPKNCVYSYTIQQSISTISLPASTNIVGERVTCQGEQTYEIMNPVAYTDYTWSTTSGNYFRTPFQAHKTTVQWNIPGTRVLTLTSTTQCGTTRTENISVEVPSSPPAPVNITGNQAVCLDGSSVSYSVPPNTSILYKWIVQGGEILAQTNEQIQVKWGLQGPYSLSVTPKLGCFLGATSIINITGLDPNKIWYADKDGDSFGNPQNTQASCIQPVGFVSDDQDCDDENEAINPTTKWYQDHDADGFGNASIFQSQCTQPIGFVLDQSDCNDEDAELTPENNCIITGIEKSKTMPKVYPNPCSGQCQISEVDYPILDFRMIDCYGKICEASLENGVLNVRGVAPGVYTVEFKKNSREMVRLRIIVTP